MKSLWLDVRLALRLARRDWQVTVGAITCLALGIGAATSVYTVAMALAFRPLPGLKQPQRLVVLREEPTTDGTARERLSYAAYQDLSAASVFSSMGAFAWSEANILDPVNSERVAVIRASGDFFRTLGVNAMLGRMLTPTDERDESRVVVLSAGLWRRRFGERRDALGQALLLDGQAHVIVGVAPENLVFPPGAQVWVPLTVAPAIRLDRNDRRFRVIARLHDGTTIDNARAVLMTFAANLERVYPAASAGWTIRADAAESYYGSRPRSLVVVLLGAVVLVLGLACANVAGLLLARGVTRQREIAVRRALGASPADLVRLLFTEAAILGAAGAIAGVVLSAWGVRLLGSVVPAELREFLPGFVTMRLDVRALGFATVVAVLAAVVFGIVPALQAVRTGVGAVLSATARDAGGGIWGRRARDIVVGAQLAVALMLLSATATLVDTFITLGSGDLGFRQEGVMTARVSLPDHFARDRAAVLRAFGDLDGAMSSRSGAHALVSTLPMSWNDPTAEVRREGDRDAVTGSILSYRLVSPGFFKIMSIPLIEGRGFATRDDTASAGAAILSRRAARHFFGSGAAIGERMLLGGSRIAVEVVGIVGDVRQNVLLANGEGGVIYRPLAQAPATSVWSVDRRAGATHGLLRTTVSQVVPGGVISEERSMEDVVRSATSPQRAVSTILSVLVLVALALSGAGLYGILVHNVLQRTQEIGIRMALGAVRRDVTRIVFQRAGAVVGVGVVAGLLGSIALAPVLRTFVAGSRAQPLVGLVVPACVLLIVAGIAMLVPTRRATAVSPMSALRQL